MSIENSSPSTITSNTGVRRVPSEVLHTIFDMVHLPPWMLRLGPTSHLTQAYVQRTLGRRIERTFKALFDYASNAAIQQLNMITDWLQGRQHTFVTLYNVPPGRVVCVRNQVLGRQGPPLTVGYLQEQVASYNNLRQIEDELIFFAIGNIDGDIPTQAPAAVQVTNEYRITSGEVLIIVHLPGAQELRALSPQALNE